MEEKKPAYGRLRVPPHPLEVWAHIYEHTVGNGKAGLAKDYADEGMSHFIEVRDRYLNQPKK